MIDISYTLEVQVDYWGNGVSVVTIVCSKGLFHQYFQETILLMVFDFQGIFICVLFPKVFHRSSLCRCSRPLSRELRLDLACSTTGWEWLMQMTQKSISDSQPLNACWCIYLVGGFNPSEKYQNWNLPQVGVKRKNAWKHHLATQIYSPKDTICRQTDHDCLRHTIVRSVLGCSFWEYSVRPMWGSPSWFSSNN